MSGNIGIASADLQVRAYGERRFQTAPRPGDRRLLTGSKLRKQEAFMRPTALSA
jgi:hypothetical protein